MDGEDAREDLLGFSRRNKMKEIKFERHKPAPDGIHSGIQFNEYTPEGQVFTVKDIVLGTACAFILLVAYCIVGSLEG